MKKYTINKGLITQKLGNKLSIFDGEQSVLYTFNETASYIFPKLKLGWEINRINEALIKRYGISKKKAQNDVTFFINDLLTKKIITHKKE